MQVRMVDGAPSSDRLDPLGGYSLLSLLSRTFRTSTSNAPPPSDLETDLDSLHSHLRSVALRSPNKLLEQAKDTLDSSSDLLNSEIQSNARIKDEHEVVAARLEENQRERRPGLGRKRPRFSMKPNASESIMDLEPTLEISKLKDPEEFFKAFERLENAKRELQRQRGGVLTDLNQDNPSPPARRRRPGILGPNRKLVKYRHLYPSVPSENDETIISSQDTVEGDTLQTSSHGAQQETIILDVASQEGELTGSVGNAENKLNDLLDELLSANEEDLDGDGALNILQERLQIKPINFEKLCLPDLQDILRNDLKASGGKLPKPRKPLSDVHNLLQEISIISPAKHRQEAESPSHLASPTPPKSPFASLSMLKRSIFRSNPSNNPYSALNIDESPAINSSPAEYNNKVYDQGDQHKKLSISGKLKPLIPEEEDNAVVKAGSVEVEIVDSSPTSKESMDVNSTRVGSGICVGSSGSHGDLEDKSIGSNVDEDSSRPDADNNIQINEPNKTDDSVENMLQKAVASAQPDINMEDLPVDNLDSSGHQWDQSGPASVEDDPVDGPSKTPQISPEKHVENIQEPFGESPDEERSRVSEDGQRKNIQWSHKERKRRDSSLGKSLAGKSNPAAVEGRETSGPSKITDIGPEQHVEQNIQESSRVSLNEQEPSRASLDDQNKNILHPGKVRKRRDLSLRKSLAGAGTSWESGVRQSTRIRTKPSEYWKGERFLCGHIHQNQSGPASVEDDPVDGPSKTPQISPEKHVENIQEPSGESPDEERSRVSEDGQRKNTQRSHKERKRRDSSLGKSLAVEGHETSGPSKITDIGPEQHVEQNIQESSRASLDEQEPSRASLADQNKNILHPGKVRKQRDLSLRKSLAGAGTSWESGVRRSTRIRTKPLEYWKGERFLYGRIHQSLATVIGLKYESPGKSGKPTMKVKSFVSDEYKELVDLVGLH